MRFDQDIKRDVENELRLSPFIDASDIAAEPFHLAFSRGLASLAELPVRRTRNESWCNRRGHARQ